MHGMNIKLVIPIIDGRNIEYFGTKRLMLTFISLYYYYYYYYYLTWAPNNKLWRFQNQFSYLGRYYLFNDKLINS
jgi:hypothetical protein